MKSHCKNRHEYTPENTLISGGKFHCRACMKASYERRRAGIPRPQVPTLAERLWAKVDKSSGCWEWTGYINSNGYGKISLAGAKNALAHRVAFELTNGPIAEGAFVCHRCDNRKCINPEHLFLGSPQDNMDDMWAKGRGKALKSCKRGHEFTVENTYLQGTTRICKECRRINRKASKQCQTQE